MSFFLDLFARTGLRIRVGGERGERTGWAERRQGRGGRSKEERGERGKKEGDENRGRERDPEHLLAISAYTLSLEVIAM